MGSTIEVLKWRPLTCDTPSVIKDFRAPSFWFTGAVQVVFQPDRQLFLTWTQVGTAMVLNASETNVWGPHVLDSIIASAEAPWGSVRFATLVEARFFTFAHLENAPVVAVRHTLQSDDEALQVWIGVGWSSGIDDADDLWVGAKVDPPNVGDLVEIGRVGA